MRSLIKTEAIARARRRRTAIYTGSSVEALVILKINIGMSYTPQNNMGIVVSIELATESNIFSF